MTDGSYLRRIDADRNMARFYAMSVQPTELAPEIWTV